MRNTVLLSIGLFAIRIATAQPVFTNVRTVNLSDGLPHSSVNQVLQDQRGFIWFATRHGIARFDGLEIKTYHPATAVDPETAADEIPVLHESAEGQLWLGYHFCPARLFRYDVARDTFLPFAYREGLEAERQAVPSAARAIWESPDRTLWVATGLHGLLAFDLSVAGDTVPYRQYRYREDDPHGLPSDFMAPGLWQDKHEQVWALTEAGLACYRPTSDDFRTFRWGEVGEDPFAAEGLNLLPDTARGCFWIGTMNGLLRVDMKTGEAQRFQLVPGAPFSELNNICWAGFLDDQGRVWVSIGVSQKARFWLFDPAKETFYPVMSEQNGKPVQLHGASGMYKDRNGTIWTSGIRAVEWIDPQAPRMRRLWLPQSIDNAHAVNERVISSLAEDQDGGIWLAFLEHGLWVWDRQAQTLQAVTSPAGSNGPPPGERIHDIELSDEDRYLWVATDHKVYRLQLSNLAWRSFDPYPTKPEFALYNELHAWNGSIWGGCFQQGMFRISSDLPERIIQYTRQVASADSLGNDLNLGSPMQLLPSQRPGRLWLGLLHRGLFEWDDQARHFYPHLPRLRVNALYEQNDSLLWIAAESGLHLYDFREKQLIPLPYLSTVNLGRASGIVSDAQGLLWVSFSQGLVAIEPRRRQVLHRITTIGQRDAAVELMHYGRIALRTSDNYLFITGNKGLLGIQPTELVYDSIPPQIAFRELRIGDRVWHNPDARQEKLVFRHDQNDLVLLPSVLHYRLPEENRLFYRLDNYDDDWRNLSPGQKIEYPNLPPGKYRLFVKAANSDGVEGTEELALRWRIRPPWYATGWAYLLYSLVVTGLLFVAYRWQLQRQREAAERRYWEELDAAKSQLFANISHEFRTPLTLILGESQSLLGKLSGTVQGQAERIQRSGKRLLWLVNQLLDLARADSGFLQLEPQRADILPFLRYSMQAFAALAEPRNIELRFLTSVDTMVMDYDPERLQRVLSNLLLNALKYTPDGGRVTLQVDEKDTEHGTQLRIAVRDTGSGIAAEDLPLIFDRFHRVNAEQEGVGIGLAVARQLVELMDGTIAVDSSPGEGTIFTITLPITRQAPPGVGEWVSGGAVLPTTASDEKPAAPPAAENLPHLLIVEDNADLRAFLRSCLDRHYQLTLARDGREGLELAQAEVFDLIISDVMMPRMDGFELCRTLKADPGTSHVPLILLTARADLSSRLQGLARGAEAYLAKPFEPVELRLQVAQLLKQRRQLQTYYQGLSQGGTMPIPELPVGEQVEQAFVLRAREAVLAHLAEETFGVEELAQKLALSRSQLHRKLTHLTEQSASRFMRAIRLTEARRLLNNPQLTIAEVAYACGFRDPDYFTRVFRQEFDLTPTTYRRQAGNRGAAT